MNRISEAEPKLEQPGWTNWREAAEVAAHPPFLKKTVRVAVVVGTILFLINHGDTVWSGKAGIQIYAKGLMTYLVPFCVANWGVLVATRKHRED